MVCFCTPSMYTVLFLSLCRAGRIHGKGHLLGKYDSCYRTLVIYIELFMYMVAPLYRLLLLLLLTARYYGLNRLEVCVKTWMFQQTLSQGHYSV